MNGNRIAVAFGATVMLAFPASAAASADGVRAAQWHLSALDARRAHDTTRGQGTTVALIDTGVDSAHEDLKGAVVPGADLFPDPLGDGRSDIDGHGTEMAGIIVGRGHGKSAGALGIAPEAVVLPIRGPINRVTSPEYLARAVSVAKRGGAGVINMSFGTTDSEALHRAVRAALDADIVVVAASGNRNDGSGDFPGRYPEVLTVGAVGRDGRVADFSVTGPQVDLVAPGVDIVTTGIGRSGYYRGSGTSEATAVVSGAAALVRAAHPELSAAEVVHRLVATAEDAGAAGRDDVYGHGRLDLVRALTAEVEPPAAGSSAVPVAEGGKDAAPAAVPKRVSPLVVTGVAAGGVLLVGGVVVALMVFAGRRRGGYGGR